MKMTTRAAILTAPHAVEIQNIEIEANDNQVIVKVKACGLCNWELNHWGGTFGTYPQGFGHEWSGVIHWVGANVKNLKVGDRVAVFPSAECTRGFCDYAVAGANDCFILNDDIDLENAMLEPLKCIMTVVRGTSAKVGDFGVVLGAGPMGLWCTQALSGHLLAGLIAIDYDDNKLALAKKYGATHTINPSKCDAMAELNKITNGHMADFVIEGTGIPEVLNSAMQYAGKQGIVCMMSSHERAGREIDFTPAIGKGLQIRAVHPEYSGILQLDDARRAFELINNGTLKMKELISHRFKLEDIETAMKTLANKPKDYIKGAVVWDD